MSMGLFQAPMSPIASVVVAQDGSGHYNGTTGECIQDAVDSLGAAGGWVHIKSGTYTITSTAIITESPITLTGVYGKTTLQLDGVNGCVVSGANAFLYCENLTVDGDSSGGSGFIVGSQVTPPTLQLDRCIVHDCVGTGIKLECGGENSFINNCVVYDNAEHGIAAFNYIPGLVIQSNILHGNSKYGIAVVRDVNSPKIFNILENFTYENGFAGIDVGRCVGGIVSGNHSYNNSQDTGDTYAGLLVWGSEKINITDNLLFDNQDTATQKYGLDMSDLGIYSNSNCLIDDNTAWDNATLNYLIEGTNNVIGENGDW